MHDRARYSDRTTTQVNRVTSMSAPTRVPLPAGTGPGLPADVHRWAASAPMRDLVAAFGGTLPGTGPAELLAWLEEFSARHWDFRTAGHLERHEIEAPGLTRAHRAAVTAAATALGFAGAGEPPLREYDHVLVLGGMARTCVQRVRHAAGLIRQGRVRTRRVTALGSFRPLSPVERHALAGPAESEADALETAMRAAFDAGGAPPQSGPVRALGRGLHVLAAPPGEPGARRANTADTYRFWAAEAGAGPGDRVLIVTSPMYVPFQHCDALRLLTLPYGCLVHTVGLDARHAAPAVPPAATGADRYLQEIRSAIRSMRLLLAATGAA